MKTLDYINVRDAQVHGLVNPTFIMYGNCSLKDYSFEVTVDGKKREARFLPDLASDNYELTLSLSKDDSKVKVYLIHDDQKELVCVRKNTLMKRIKSKIRTLLQKTVRKIKETNNKVKVNTYAIGKEVKYIAKEYHFVLTPNRLKQSKRRIKENKKTKNKFLDVYNFLNQKEYLLWLEKNEKPFEEHPQFSYNPLISICIPVYNVERKYLAECLDSILNQTYQNFEICLSNDCSTLQETIDTLNEYEKKDSRIKVHHRKENGHISKATNDALNIASGEFIGLMDNDDLLARNALAECVAVLNKNKELDFIYTDEDKMDMKGLRRDPHFKSDYAPDSLLGSNYICHFEIMRKSIVDEINTYEELRNVDDHSTHLNNETLSLIADVFKINVEQIKNIKSSKKGMTNRSFLFEINQDKYIMRIPGEGTDQLINRKEEYEVYQVIKDLNISDEVIYMNPQNGYKITKYLNDTRVCNQDDQEDLRKCMQLLKYFHQQDLKVDHEFNVFEKIDFYEKLRGPKSLYKDYDQTKEKIFSLKNIIEKMPKEWRLCHIDANCDNFLFYKENEEEKIKLIDWEYAAMQDIHLDIAMFCIYSMYNRQQVDNLIDIYFENKCDQQTRIKIYCYISMCGLLWSNWCEYKYTLGVEFGKYSLAQYRFAKDYYNIVIEEMENMK